MDSHPPLHPHLAGSPGVLHLSVDTRPPHTPRAVRCVHVLVTSASVAGFSTFGRVATANGFTRPNRVRLRWARVFALVACSRLAPRPVSGDRSVSRPWLPADAGPKLHGERAIHMTDTSQSAREMSVTGTPKNRRDQAEIRERELAGRRPRGAGARESDEIRNTSTTRIIRCLYFGSRRSLDRVLRGPASGNLLGEAS